MDAKDKAKELYDKFEKLFIDANADSWGEEAKQCALISVQEIIESHLDVTWYIDSHTSNTDYWQQVKEEITKL